MISSITSLKNESIKEDVVYIYNGILLSHKKEQNWVICRDMDGLGRHYAKWNKSDRERQILYDITYMWNLKNTTNEFIYKTNWLTDIANKLMVIKGEGGRDKLGVWD